MQRFLYPVLSLVFIGLALPLLIGAGSPDLTALYVAGFAVSQGFDAAIYAPGADLIATPTPMISEMRAELGLSAALFAPYVSPPLWAWLIAPMTNVVSHSAFVTAALVAHLVMLCASVGLAWKIIRPPHVSFHTWVIAAFVLLAVTVPSLHALAQNQPHILTLFLVLLAFERYRAGHFAAAGVILALAAAFKLAPLFLVLVFILERNWRASAAFAVTGGLLAALSIALAGWEVHGTFLALVARINEVVVLAKDNFAPELLIYQLLGGQTQSLIAPEPFWLSTLMAALMLAALAALILMRPRLIPHTAVPVLLLGFSTATALFGPVSWSYLFILSLLMLPTLFHIMSQASAWKMIALLGLAQSYPVYRLLEGLSDSFFLTTLAGVLCFGGLLVTLIAIVLRAVRFEPEVPIHFR